MDIYRRSKLKTTTLKKAEKSELNPFKGETKVLRKGFKRIGDGRIMHIESGFIVIG